MPNFQRRFGDSSLQERVNQQSCERLQGYCSTLTDRLPHTAGIQSLPDLLSSLDRSVQTKKRKNVEVLWIAATVTRQPYTSPAPQLSTLRVKLSSSMFSAQTDIWKN
ncbi:type II inositol 3,4-bisphosphate 4-phosphatase-like [Perca fluviatilis]|uniref:type II inositol 3,4-bisphosphate 4-phosphatase-like n=1 Tax=Perca fluviatilis TaxID=8168 RepID=UPI001965F23B|nr:type II inositol 3,4-bisphosphate 4-phosphatase-like [Perca fluviatilis]